MKARYAVFLVTSDNQSSAKKKKIVTDTLYLGAMWGVFSEFEIGLSIHLGASVDGASSRMWKLADFLLKHVIDSVRHHSKAIVRN